MAPGDDASSADRPPDADPLAGLPRRLLALRARAGLSQGAFAERLGFPKRTYISWEQGHAEPPLRLLVAVERELGVDASWLLQGPEPEPRPRGAAFDRARLARLLTAVAGQADHHRRRFGPAELLELALVIYDEPADHEERSLRLLDRSFRVREPGV